MVGAMLRALARREQKHDLTELEQRLTDQFTALYGDEQAAEFGRIYQEPRYRTGIAALFPSVVAGRSLEEGLGAEDVVAYVRSAADDIATLPGVRQVTVDDLGQGALTGEERVVLVTAPPTAGTDYEIAAINETRIRLVEFKCDRKSGEWGSDEIYWGASSASDLQSQIIVLTPEYGDITAGSVRSFGSDAWFFKGPAEAFVVGHMQCWEADPGGNDYNRMRQALTDAARECALAASLSAAEGDFTNAIALGLAAATQALINWILGFNKDDLVKELTIAYHRDALVRMAQTNGGRFPLVFDGGGGGKHTMTMEVSFGPLVATALRHSTYYAGEWSLPVDIPQLISGSLRPSMVSHGNVLYAVYRKGDIVQIGTYDGVRWSEARTLKDESRTQDVWTAYDPTVIMMDGKPHLVWSAPKDPGRNSSVLLHTQELDLAEGRLTGPQSGTEMSTYSQVAVVEHNGQQYCFDAAHFGSDSDKHLYAYRFNTAYHQWVSLTDNGFPLFKCYSDAAMAVASFQGRMWLFYRENQGGRQNLVAWSGTNGREWRQETLPAEIGRNSAALAPSVTVATHGLYNNPQPHLFLSYPSAASPLSMETWRFDGRDWTKSGVPLGTVGLGSWSPFVHQHTGALHMLFSAEEPLPTPPKTKHWIRTGSTWQQAPDFPWPGHRAPALASYNDSLYAVYPRAEDKTLMWSRLDGTKWSTPQAIRGTNSDHATALAVYQGKLYCFHIAGDGSIRWRIFNGSTWTSGSAVAPGHRTYHPVALAVDGDTLWVGERSTDGELHLNSLRGTTWAAHGPMADHWHTSDSFALAALNGGLHAVHRGTNGEVWLATREHGGSWSSEKQPNKSWWITTGPSMTVHNGKLVLCLPGGGESLYIPEGTATSTDTAWGASTRINGSAYREEAYLASHDGKLHLMHREP
ncbi:hypothetical protein [Streptomyces celluloflavus]|uniref:Uncharacterized protein n=1 Tax=Streptomyces celluloflavus TaxID=58344 RepID=A0ABW7RCY6_9ACTN|nr:hypothetical protein OG717_23225 [Streptomyces celluloflavus]